ncbi:Pentatricopeptide repeat-containing protein [Camellia lanceoleosa]|uniref:Pentatricopeptide repeat-containing protein n=1 Tax=Camellia lanceoleosa TaxID=1840588 RepID=A0ACC0IGQ9_9ERIC|nr:Pentatricopeptide repeat-containing protein [Camellia lanceoleosa]
MDLYLGPKAPYPSSLFLCFPCLSFPSPSFSDETNTMLVSRAPELSLFTFSLLSNSNPNPKPSKFISIPMRTALTILRSLAPSLHHYHHHRRLLRSISLPTLSFSGTPTRRLSSFAPPSAAPLSTFVEHLADETDSDAVRENSNFSRNREAESFNFDVSFESTDLKNLHSPPLEVRELEELPEQWRRTKLAWLCKELPTHKAATLIRILNAQRKWIRQEDATYLAVHCMRIRENETGFRVYKWMMQQHWFQFDFALSTRLADFMGKERKYIKCREIFDDIINQGRVPSESTFHFLIVAYLSSPVQGCLEEACSIYNRMIQLGGYNPRLSLHNSLFKALVSKPGGFSKHYLKQAEFIFHNLASSGLEIHKDIYGGLIWIHSYQDTIDKERIASLRAEMQVAGIEESREVLVSEAERTWLKLLHCDGSLPSQAFVYRMEVYAKVGQRLKSLELFREMQEQLGSTILMKELMESGLKPLMPCFIDLMDMYLSLDLHDKLESTFSLSLEKCRPNRTIYNIYLDSLVKIGNIEKVKKSSTKWLVMGQLVLTADQLEQESCQETHKLEVQQGAARDFGGVAVRRVAIESDEERKNHAIRFEFSGKLEMHSILKRHIHDQYNEWLASFSKPIDDSDDIPYQFITIKHSYFGFYRSVLAKRPTCDSKVNSSVVVTTGSCILVYVCGLQNIIRDILLKSKGSQEGVDRIVKAMKAKSLDCKVKRKGEYFG